MEWGGEMGDPPENPPTSDIFRHDSHIRKSGSDHARNRTRLLASHQGELGFDSRRDRPRIFVRGNRAERCRFSRTFTPAVRGVLTTARPNHVVSSETGLETSPVPVRERDARERSRPRIKFVTITREAHVPGYPPSCVGASSRLAESRRGGESVTSTFVTITREAHVPGYPPSCVGASSRLAESRRGGESVTSTFVTITREAHVPGYPPSCVGASSRLAESRRGGKSVTSTSTAASPLAEEGEETSLGIKQRVKVLKLESRGRKSPTERRDDSAIRTINSARTVHEVRSYFRHPAACATDRRPREYGAAASSGTIPTCENPGATPLGIEPGSPRWEASSLTTTPPRKFRIVRISLNSYLCCSIR
ncbi:hypothetical protein PR048_024970 [Dryococelus australis]|uniref:Uncharacterized protein n=1 Tax=Dryococelus australis TaxID=614101 RepID=A0ABQ9GQ17_9NEOP|nr:hypothetical protein PR048_024970 [Dryococelus australis]